MQGVLIVGTISLATELQYKKRYLCSVLPKIFDEPRYKKFFRFQAE